MGLFELSISAIRRFLEPIMDPHNLEKQREEPQAPRYLDFPHAPETNGSEPKKLNKFSSTLTKDHDFPGAQVGFLKA